MDVPLGEGGVLTAGTGDNKVDEVMAEHERPCSCTLASKASIRADVVDVPIEDVVCCTGAAISTCSTSSCVETTSVIWATLAGDNECDAFREAGEKLCIRESISSFSSFSSSRSFNSRTSVSRLLTRSSSDSV